MQPAPLRRLRPSLVALLGLGLAAAPAVSPLRAQTGICSTEVILYVDKTESTNARETARAVLNQLNLSALSAPGPITLTVFAFSGEVPIATFTGLAGVPLPTANLQELFDQTILQEPSSAVTFAPDYLALFSHIEDTVRNRPNLANRRVFIAISDFSTRRGEVESENSLPSAISQRLAALRQLLVAGGKQRFLAIRTRPRQEPSPSLQNDLLGEISKNFSLVEDEGQLPVFLNELLTEDNVPLQVELAFDPATLVYSLTLANPSCTGRTNIQYFTRVADNNTLVALPFCPTSLRAGDAGTCTFTPAQIVLPPLPNTCLNAWLQVVSQVDTGAAAAPVAAGVAAAALPRLVGTANKPILAGNCVFVRRFEVDQAKKLETSLDLADCERAAPNVAHPRNQFVACLQVRGRLQNDARLRIRPADDLAAPPILDRPLTAATFNGDAFHGGERTLPVFFPLPRLRSSWMCSPTADLNQRRLAYEVVGTGGVRLASGFLGRVLPAHPGGATADLLRKLLLPLLALLLLGGIVANSVRTASLGVLDAVLLVLGLAFLALAFLAYEESGLGGMVSNFFGSNSFVVALAALGALALVYWLLFAKGFFDRKLSAPVRASLISRAPLVERRRRRLWRTALTVGLALLFVIGMILLLWLYPPELGECRYSLVDLPANTQLPSVNRPASPATP